MQELSIVVRGEFRMRHADAVNRLLRLLSRRRYLEIGVSTGDTFFAVEAESKTAVDPHFWFDAEGAAARMPNAKLFQMTSDEFFSQRVSPEAIFDLIFLDGLHTFEQTLRDFCNAVTLLAPDGIILIDDVVPNSYPASLADPNRASGVRSFLNPQDPDQSWMGDVYKLVFFVETFFPQFRFATVAGTMALVVWRSRRSPAEIVQRSVSRICRMDFADTIFERATYRVVPLEDIVGQILATRG